MRILILLLVALSFSVNASNEYNRYKPKYQNGLNNFASIIIFKSGYVSGLYDKSNPATSVDELIKESNDNQLKFERNRVGKSIRVKGSIKSISSGSRGRASIDVYNNSEREYVISYTSDIDTAMTLKSGGSIDMQCLVSGVGSIGGRIFLEDCIFNKEIIKRIKDRMFLGIKNTSLKGYYQSSYTEACVSAMYHKMEEYIGDECDKSEISCALTFKKLDESKKDGCSSPRMMDYQFLLP
ncbi:hypothetical protein ACULN0_10740 [Pectobacterium actinidiae]|uniref:hypothetical protein n=1 Tax=Pectobacterium actinidiae TaxID=1507808 RepID=UPI0040408FFA